MFFALNCWTNILFLLQKHVLHKCKLAWLWVRFDKCLAERSDSNVLIWWSHAKFQQEKYKEIRFTNNLENQIYWRLIAPWLVKFLYTSLYTWSDVMICFDSELFPQNFVWQLNNDRKSLDLYNECLK